MSAGKQKTTRWLYGLAILFPILACLGTALLVYQKVPKLPGALEITGIKNLTQVVIPGSAEIYFPKAGAYAVYYEYRSVINGVRYIRNETPPRLSCQLKSKVTGADVELASPDVEGDIYVTQNQERVGRLLKSINIDKPGVYLFSCQYAQDSTAPEIVLAVGPNIIWEFLNIAAKPLAAFVCGGLVFGVALGMSILMIGFVALIRHQSRNRLATQT
jgi:hypothetical protein